MRISTRPPKSACIVSTDFSIFPTKERSCPQLPLSFEAMFTRPELEEPVDRAVRESPHLCVQCKIRSLVNTFNVTGIRTNVNFWPLIPTTVALNPVTHSKIISSCSLLVVARHHYLHLYSSSMRWMVPLDPVIGCGTFG